MSKIFRSRPRNNSLGLLIVASGGLGDAVLFSLVLQRFAELANGNEQPTILIPETTKKMSFIYGPNIETIAVDYNRIMKEGSYRRKIIRHLNKRDFRLVISTDYLRHPKKDEVLIRACQTAERIAMLPRPWKKYDRLLKNNFSMYDRMFESGPPVLDKVTRWSRFANWLTGQNLPPPMIRLPEEKRPTPSNLKKPAVILVPFSAVLEKQSPAAFWEEIAETLPADYEVIVAGAPDDPEKNPSFLPLLKREHIKYCGATFEELAPILRSAKLVISVDTATMHLAVALGTPTLCLASAAYVNEIVPYAPEITPPNAHFIYTQIDCQSCLGNCIHPPENGMYRCVARINPNPVKLRIHELLGETTR